MARIEVIRDPQVKLEPIVHALKQPSEAEINEAPGNPSEMQQTKVFGLIVPIIALNGVAVDFQDVETFELDYTGKTPRIKTSFHDRGNILNNFSNPGNDNELRVQILPPFDNTYKKIDLVFLCTSVQIEAGIVEVEGEYRLQSFSNSQFKALGQITTYELFDKVSTETGLGFATNSEATEDARFIQCQFESYKDVIDREMEKSGSSEAHVYDWWVDVWNNLILCDLYDRINSEDPEEDMKIWVAENNDAASTNDDPEPVQTLALFTNHPVREHTDLYIYDYHVQNDPASSARGNSVTMSIYEENKHEWIDHHITDGDIKKNVFERYEYMGEVYGDYNYLLAEQAREIYLRKIKSETLVLHTIKPQLGIMRGDQLRFVWYDADMSNAMNQDNLEEAGTIKSSEQLSAILGWVKDWDFSKVIPDNPLRVNLQYSGQYTCVGQYITYSRAEQWNCWLYLARPAEKRPQVLNELNEENGE